MGNSFASVILSLGEWGWEFFCLRDFFLGGRGGGGREIFACAIFSRSIRRNLVCRNCF